MPHYVPPVKGENILYLYPTALDLHNYIKANMPWQDKGALSALDYWQLTSFLLQMNGIDPGTKLLDAKSAAKIILNPSAVTPTVQPAAGLPLSSAQFPWLWLGVPAALIIVVGIVLSLSRARK